MSMNKISPVGKNTFIKKAAGKNSALPLNSINLAASAPSKILSSDGLGSKICRIIMSKAFPVEKLIFSSLFEYMEDKQKHVLGKGSTTDEKKALMSLSLLDHKVDYLLSSEIVQKKLEQSGITDFSQHFEYKKALSQEASSALRQLEPAILPPDRTSARAITQHFGKGYKLFLDELRGRLPDHPFDIVTKNFFDQCLHAEKRVFAAKWEKDYAEMLACLTAVQLHKEWLRIASLTNGENISPPYRSTVHMFRGDGLNYISPRSVSVISAEHLYLENIYTMETFKHLVFRSVALADIYSEWASRHWDQNSPENSGKKALNAAKIDFADYMNKFLPLASSEIPPEKRPVVKILNDSPLQEVFNFLRPQDIQR